MTTMTAPTMASAALQQRMDALYRANQVRVRRAEFKRRAAATPQLVADVLRQGEGHKDWDVVATMEIGDLLIALPRVGPAKRLRVAKGSRVSLERSLDRCTDRQRLVVLRTLASECPSLGFRS